MTHSLVRFQRWHLAFIRDRGLAEGGFQLEDEPSTLAYLEQSPNIWTLLYGKVPLACGGTLKQWPGRHMAWAYLSVVTAEHMLAITRAAYRCVRAAPGRVETTVRLDFEPGHRWAKMLGFHIETPLLLEYGPQRESHVGYVMFNRS